MFNREEDYHDGQILIISKKTKVSNRGNDKNQ